MTRYQQAYSVLEKEPWLSGREVARKIGLKNQSLFVVFQKSGVNLAKVRRDIIQGIMKENQKLKENAA